MTGWLGYTTRFSTAPDDYHCSKCHVHGVKLWRQYQTFANQIELLCAKCAVIDQGKTGTVDSAGKLDGEYGKSDQIGWLVPAVPTEENDTYWGYTSVPQEGCDWWRNLATNPSDLVVAAKEK